MKNYFTIALFVLSGALMSFGTSDIDTVKNALAKGDANTISAKFSTSVQMSLPDSKGLYSKSQATQVIKSFFVKNVPSAASVIHKGSSAGGANYVIYNLETSNGEFRVQVFMKDGSTGTIHEIKIKRA